MAADILLIIMGFILCYVIFSIKKKYKYLSENGEKVEGTLVDYEYTKVKNRDIKVPVVRFATQDEQWITKKTEESYFPTTAKKGTKVIVFYNPGNPEEFLIQSKKFRLFYITILIGGIVFILSGFILLLNGLNIIHLFKNR